MKKYSHLLISTALLIPASASAVMLSGSASDFAINGTTVMDRPELAGTILEDVSTNFTISGAGEALSGTIENRVVRSSVDGTIDFYWRIKPTSGKGDLSAFRIGGFDGFSLNADWRSDSLGDIGPDIARYFGDGSGKVNFLFSNQVGNAAAGGYETSKFFFLDTNATSYDQSGQFDLLCASTGCVSDVYSTFAPAVPVPAAVWLFGSGLMGLIGIARRKTSI